MESIRVLHVDDEPSFGDLVSDFLEREDGRMEVVTETSAGDALERLGSENGVDCIVSDYDMPGMDGLEFLDAIRADHPNLPFVLYTGKGSEEVAGDAISKGATDYLQKGGGTEQYELLANRVRNAVQQYRSTQEADRTRQRLEELTGSTPDCLWMFDRDWEELLFISGYEAVWDRPAEAIRENPRDFLKGVAPDYRDGVQSAMERLSNGESVDIEYPIVRGGGDRGWVWVKGEPIFDEEGDVVRVVGFTRDATERKRRERELRRYERIVGNLPVGLFRTTWEGEIVSANEAAVSIYGAESETQLLDHEVQDLYVDLSDREPFLEALETEGLVDNYPLRMQTLSGVERSLEFTARLVEGDGRRYIDGIMQDVTEERERRRQLERAETIFEHAQDAIFLQDVGEELTYLQVNPAYEETTGLKSEEIRGLRPQDVIEEGAELEQLRWECIERREPIEYQRELTINGDRAWWHTRIAPVVIDGAVEQLVGVTRDITDHVERERELKRKERRYQAVFNDPNILAGVLDTDGQLLEVNSTALEYVEADREDVLGSPLWETPWWAGESEGTIREKVTEAATGEYVEYEVNMEKPDGEPYSVAGVVRPVTDEEGEVVSLIVSARDITERRERERRLQQYETVVETTDDIAFAVDRDGTIDFAEESLLGYLDATPEDLRGREVMALIEEFVAEDDDPSRFAETLDWVFRAGEDGSPERLELALAVEGDRRVFEFQFSPVVTGDEVTAVVVTMRDITERKRREHRLERQNERFDDLADAVSHDLQTPLETARTRAELAVETGEIEHVEKALTALDRANELREGLVDVLRTREIVQEREPVNVGRIAGEAWEMIRSSEDASLQFADPPIVEWDPDALRRLLENLLSNAVEHGGDDVTVRIGRTDGGFYVEDDGPGIPVEDRESVFTPGFSTKPGGSGVGMASVQEIAAAHDWAISIAESDAGGARFEITPGGD